jgi:Caspase domain
VAWSVNISADGRFVIATLGDGTIRWYTNDKGEEVLALFVDSDLHRQRWVAWNPDGFFTFKGGGDSLIGYQINHGPNQPGEFVKVDQLREVFYRADLIDQILTQGGIARVAAAHDRVGDISQVLLGGLPPEIELVSPTVADATDEYLLQFRVKDQGGGHGRVVTRIDGVEIEGRSVEISGSGADTINRSIPIGSGTHTLTIAAYSANGKILGPPTTAKLTGRQIARGSAPSLYVIAAGISHYSDNSLSAGVKFAEADAELVAQRFKEQEGRGLYAKVTTVSLPDSRATTKGIRDAIALAAKSVQPGDTFVLYLAGHGLAIDGDYYFIPWEAEYTNQKDLLSASIDREAIQKLLKTVVTNKSVLILDTCHSGAYEEGRDAASEKAAIEKVATMSGRAVLAASNTDQMAMDGYRGHGAFTYALLEGLRAADSDAQGQILITRLAEYVQRSVPTLTEEKWGYRQSPLSTIQGEPFPIAHKAAN